MNENERNLSEEITEGFKALDQLGLAESIIKQQELRIAELQAKIDEMAGEIMTLENRIGAMTGYGHN
jgi:peptidoglycan hydrolase CwlO-like protein